MEQLDTNTANLFFATAGGITLIVLVSVWSVVWKAIALWKAARRNEIVWYIVFLLINTAGILEIIYIFAVAKDDNTVK